MIYKFLVISYFAVSVILFFAEEINKSNLFDYFDNKKYLKRIGLENLTSEESFKIIRGMKDNF